MIPTLRVSLLGDFRLTVDDVPVTTVNVPRLQSLLAYLLLHRDAPQRRSHLAFLLWPDSAEAQAHTNLRKLLHQLRQTLPHAAQFLLADPQSLQWLPPHEEAGWTLDLLEMEQALLRYTEAEQRQDALVQREALKVAVRLYRGDLLPSCYDEWLLPERDRWRQTFLQAVERLIALFEEERDYAAAITTSQLLLRSDPLHEKTYRQLMRLHALHGDRAAALRVYHTCVTALERELGVAPSETTRAAYELLALSDGSASSATGPLTVRGTEPPLLGRNAEWRQLQEVWRRATGKRPHLVILTGEAGIGKTRLAEEMEAWVSRQGMMTASARCYAAFGQLAYAPVTGWLRTKAFQAGLATLDAVWLTEVERLVPEILVKRPNLALPVSMTEGWQRQHFFEALARAVLSVSQPLLLVLDDLQWCDNETLEWLQFLLRFEVRPSWLLLGTVRVEETLPGHPLVAFLGALQREGLVTEIPLGSLSTAETTALAEHILKRPLADALRETLYRETEGNPLFVVETARAGALGAYAGEPGMATSSLPLLTQPASTLPPVVQGVLATRLAQLSPLAREVASVAAVIGREFSFPVLARAGSASEDAVVQGLDELWQRRIVREQSEGMLEAYDFSHGKLREQAYGSLSYASRRLLHRRVAEALEQVYAHALERVGGQIAVHYERAGQVALALLWYRRVGETALRLFANAEAIAAFRRALSLLEAGEAGQSGSWEEGVTLSLLLGNTLALTGEPEAARNVYQHALEMLSPQEYLWRARLLHKMANTWNLASRNPLDTFHSQACLIFQEAEQLLEQVAVRSSQSWQQEWIDLHLDQLLPLRGSVAEMTAIIERVRPLVNRSGTAEQRGQFFQAVGARDSKRDHFVATAASVLQRRTALASVQETGNPVLIGFAHFSLGNHLWWSGSLSEAEQEMRMAIRLAEQTGNTRLLARGLTFLPCVLRGLDQLEAVRTQVARALTVPEARYTSLTKGHQAWIAWRDGQLLEAEMYALASLQEEEQEHLERNPFLWAGLWPLIGVALRQKTLAVALERARLLLDPVQQPPPAAMKQLLEMALQAWDLGKQAEALTVLQQSVPLAQALGYL